jgi:phosphatidylglycerophosphate synthase
LSPLERRLAKAAVPRVPVWLGTHHLTLMTLAWCAGLVIFGRLAAEDPRWLWGSSLMIALQWATDFFDGKVGKHRGTGLVKWGFYMDHLLDFAFLCAVLLGYALVLPASAHLGLLLVLAVFGGFMVNSFLAFAATGRFHISHGRLGPTEFRLALVFVNSLLVFYGTRRMAKALPYVAACGFVALCVLAYRTQRELWLRDTEQRRRAEATPAVRLARREAA